MNKSLHITNNFRKTVILECIMVFMDGINYIKINFTAFPIDCSIRINIDSWT